MSNNNKYYKYPKYCNNTYKKYYQRQIIWRLWVIGNMNIIIDRYGKYLDKCLNIIKVLKQFCLDAGQLILIKCRCHTESMQQL